MQTFTAFATAFATVALLAVAACGDDGVAGSVDAARTADAPIGIDAADPPPPPCPLSNPDDPLCMVNNAFRASYAQARAETLTVVDPVIVSIFDRVILLRAGQREEVSTIGDRYQELKSIAHVPLGVYVALVHRTDQRLDADATAALSSFQGLINDARATLDTRGFTPDQLARQQRLLDAASGFIDQVLADGQVSALALDAYTASSVVLGAHVTETIEITASDRHEWSPVAAS